VSPHLKKVPPPLAASATSNIIRDRKSFLGHVLNQGIYGLTTLLTTVKEILKTNIDFVV